MTLTTPSGAEVNKRMEFTSTLAMRRNEYLGVVTLAVERKETHRKEAPTLYNVKTYITPK